MYVYIVMLSCWAESRGGDECASAYLGWTCFVVLAVTTRMQTSTVASRRLKDPGATRSRRGSKSSYPIPEHEPSLSETQPGITSIEHGYDQGY